MSKTNEEILSEGFVAKATDMIGRDLYLDRHVLSAMTAAREDERERMRENDLSMPTKEDILKEAEKQITSWLDGSTLIEKQHYRIAFRRSFEFVVRVIEKKRSAIK